MLENTFQSSYILFKNLYIFLIYETKNIYISGLPKTFQCAKTFAVQGWPSKFKLTIIPHRVSFYNPSTLTDGKQRRENPLIR